MQLFKYTNRISIEISVQQSREDLEKDFAKLVMFGNMICDINHCELYSILSSQCGYVKYNGIPSTTFFIVQVLLKR